jgi:hypothetical protein
MQVNSTIQFGPIVGLIHNVEANTWHAGFFESETLDGDRSFQTISRYRSKGYVSSGFCTREHAIHSAKVLASTVEAHAKHPPILALDADIPWDGNGFPSISVLFHVTGRKAKPLFLD